MTASQIQSILYFPKKTPVVHCPGLPGEFCFKKKNLRAVICVNLDERWMKNECVSSTKLKIRYSILIFFLPCYHLFLLSDKNRNWPSWHLPFWWAWVDFLHWPPSTFPLWYVWFSLDGTNWYILHTIWFWPILTSKEIWLGASNCHLHKQHWKIYVRVFHLCYFKYVLQISFNSFQVYTYVYIYIPS